MAKLDAQQLRYAFGLAAAMAGGLQLNFSTMAKPAHAGFAASAGVRAVRLAAAGMTASEDISPAAGWSILHGAGEPLDPGAFALRPDRVAVKLYPSCYATSRLIGIALDLRDEVGPIFADKDVSVRLTTPAGSLRVLAYDRPVDGLKAKFSSTFPVAVALIDGPPVVTHFTEAGVRRADLTDMIDRLTVIEDPDRFYDGNLETGSVTLELFRDGERIAVRERCAGCPGHRFRSGHARSGRGQGRGLFRFVPQRQWPRPAAAGATPRHSRRGLLARLKPFNEKTHTWPISLTSPASCAPRSSSTTSGRATR